MASDEFEVLGIDQSVDDYACTSEYKYNGREFSILLCDNPPRAGYDDRTDVVDDYLDKIYEVSAHDGTNFENDIRQEEYLRKASKEIGEIVLPLLRELAPSLPEPPPPELKQSELGTVEQFLYPNPLECVKLQLVSLNGRLTLAEGHHLPSILGKDKPMTPEEMEGIGPDLDKLPKFEASEVLLTTRYRGGLSAFGASIRGEEYVCKIISNFFRDAVIGELPVLLKIQKANLDPEARIPALRGLITYQGGIIGFLLEKITEKAVKLAYIIMGRVGEIPITLKEKWASQIEHTVAELHKNDIIWGDAKPENVIIDENDDVWLIDFGGGFTPPWVDVENEGSREGDLLAVARIREKLLSSSGVAILLDLPIPSLGLFPEVYGV